MGYLGAICHNRIREGYRGGVGKGCEGVGRRSIQQDILESVFVLASERKREGK